jgi:hypothetical protein
MQLFDVDSDTRYPTSTHVPSQNAARNFARIRERSKLEICWLSNDTINETFGMGRLFDQYWLNQY